jgi:hypothetical protein
VDLQKSIREQKILLSALLDSENAPAVSDNDIESLKRRIAMVDKQIHSNESRLNSTKPELLLSRYSSRMRQLSDLADHQRSMRKEIDFTLNTTIKDLEKQISRETEKLNQKEEELARIRDLKASGSTNGSLYNPAMTEADRIRSKAQAMIAARLNKTTYMESTGTESKKVQLAIEERDNQLLRQKAKTEDLRTDLHRVLDASIEASDLERNEKQLKEQRMFEDGLFVSEELGDFIDSLRRDRAKKAGEQRTLNGINKYGPPPATPPLPRQYSPAPPPLPAPIPLRSQHSRSMAPPIPTSLRPETPRSAEAIKAEAHRRIDEKRMSLQTFNSIAPPTVIDSVEKSQLQDTQYKQQLQEAEKAAQAKLREAERQAQIRLAEFNKRKEEAEASRLAAEEEERRLKQEAERKALQEEQERLERERSELEKKKKAEEEQRLIQEQIEKERQRIEEEKQKIEREEKKARERQRKLEEETRAAEKAKEEEAERLRRAQEELERAKKVEAERRRELEAAERERQRLLEIERQRLEAEKAAAERKRKEAEELERKRKAEEEAEEERKRLEQSKEEGIWFNDLESEERRTRNSTDFSQAKSFPASFSFGATPSPLGKAETSDDESEFASESEPESEPDSEGPDANTTAGTAGFGTDLDDEVDFRTSKLLYF